MGFVRKELLPQFILKTLIIIYIFRNFCLGEDGSWKRIKGGRRFGTTGNNINKTGLRSDKLNHEHQQPWRSPSHWATELWFRVKWGQRQMSWNPDLKSITAHADLHQRRFLLFHARKIITCLTTKLHAIRNNFAHLIIRRLTKALYIVVVRVHLAHYVGYSSLVATSWS